MKIIADVSSEGSSSERLLGVFGHTRQLKTSATIFTFGNSSTFYFRLCIMTYAASQLFGINIYAYWARPLVQKVTKNSMELVFVHSYEHVAIE